MGPNVVFFTRCPKSVVAPVLPGHHGGEEVVRPRCHFATPQPAQLSSWINTFDTYFTIYLGQELRYSNLYSLWFHCLFFADFSVALPEVHTFFHTKGFFWGLEFVSFLKSWVYRQTEGVVYRSDCITPCVWSKIQHNCIVFTYNKGPLL